jgi:mono/diheme cytochrome c family protein
MMTMLPTGAISLNLALGGRAFGLPCRMKRSKSICYLRYARSIGFAIVLLAANVMVLSSRASAQDEDYLATPTPAPWQSPSAETIAQGRADFNKLCAPCHSESGKGNGPELKVIPGIKPKNLTTIAAQNGGVFPFRDVEDTIDGRKVIPSHKRFDMPFWGVNFQQQGQEFTSTSEAKTRKRIDAIVDYIATLQQP